MALDLLDTAEEPNLAGAHLAQPRLKPPSSQNISPPYSSQDSANIVQIKRAGVKLFGGQAHSVCFQLSITSITSMSQVAAKTKAASQTLPPIFRV